MIITLICVAVLILGIILMRLYNGPLWGHAAVFITGIILLTCGIVALAVILPMIGKAQIGKQVEYDIVLLEQQNLQDRIDDENFRVVGNEMVYHDALELNKKLAKVKYWSKNPWTSWFHNDLLADIDYIIFE